MRANRGRGAVGGCVGDTARWKQVTTQVQTLITQTSHLPHLPPRKTEDYRERGIASGKPGAPEKLGKREREGVVGRGMRAIHSQV